MLSPEICDIFKIEDPQHLDSKLHYKTIQKEDALSKYGKEIESKLNERYFSLRNAFRSFDLGKRGEVSEGEFISGLV